jgi:hypothetical protein
VAGPAGRHGNRASSSPRRPTSSRGASTPRSRAPSTAAGRGKTIRDAGGSSWRRVARGAAQALPELMSFGSPRGRAFLNVGKERCARRNGRSGTSGRWGTALSASSWCGLPANTSPDVPQRWPEMQHGRRGWRERASTAPPRRLDAPVRHANANAPQQHGGEAEQRTVDGRTPVDTQRVTLGIYGVRPFRERRLLPPSWSTI